MVLISICLSVKTHPLHVVDARCEVLTAVVNESYHLMGYEYSAV
jgi:hypothetical protein